MNKSVLHIVFIFSFLSAVAQQNLVPNGSFEEYYNCPLGIADFTTEAWSVPTWGTSDYFNSCNILDASVPYNFVGNQNAHNGSGYCGIGSGFEMPDPNSREYIQVELITPLEPNKDYEFSCFVSLAESSKFCIQDIGIAFSNSPIGGNYGNEISFSDTIYNLTANFLCDTVNWVELSIIFNANGGEKYLTIGQFKNVSDANFLLFNPLISSYYAYYYIDDVSLIEYEFPEIPNIFSPNSDNINDLWSIELPNGYEINIFNRWGEIIENYLIENHNYSWDGKTEKGKDCVDGVYFYSLTKNDSKKTGFIQLVR